jgi:signal peptidase I
MTDYSAPRATYAPRVSIPRPALRRPGLLRELLNSIFFIAAALVLSELALPRSSIDGPSMQPTLFAGQHLLISRLHYLFGDPQRGDIAVFDPPDAATEMLIKRVIGIPGDTIELRRKQVVIDGQERNDADLYINGVLTEEPYFINRPCSNCNGTWVLGPDEYFMMGDNRNQSNDSRNPSVGLITRDRIVGKAIWRHWPLDKFGALY